MTSVSMLSSGTTDWKTCSVYSGVASIRRLMQPLKMNAANSARLTCFSIRLEVRMNKHPMRRQIGARPHNAGQSLEPIRGT